MNLDRLITETVRKHLLVENARNNSWRAARKMVITRFGYSKEEAEKVLDELCILVGISREMIKFIKGCTRMYLNGEFNDQRVLGDFKDALNKIKTDGHIGEFDTDLRRLDQPEGAVNSAQDIIKIFKPEIDRERAEQRKNLSGRTFELNKNYKIIKINSFDDAHEYSPYTSWCVTSNEYNYNGYTNNGINQFYFCLENGFEKLKNDGDYNDKKDRYALSMLAILVNPEGELIHCTNRKNNDQGVLNPMEISELLGCNFYETFKPNTTWQDMLEDVKNKLDNGESPEHVFKYVRNDDDLVLVSLSGRWNILGEGNVFLCDHWYDEVWDFKEGLAVVYDCNKGHNFINHNGKEICDRWYDDVWNFKYGFAEVFVKGKGYNIINCDGKEICDRWYDYVNSFSEGFAGVKDKDKGWTFINHEGKEVFGRWYDGVGKFREGFARVLNKDKGCNFINHDGKEICGRWYDFVNSFSEGFADVHDYNKGCNFINHEGKEICDRWYDEVGSFHEGFASVCDENKGWNFINREGNEVCDRWYDEVWSFKYGFAKINDKNKGYNFIGKDSKEISDQWYEETERFSSAGYAQVYTTNKGWFFIDVNGNEVNYETVYKKTKDQGGITRRRRRVTVRKPIQEEPIDVVESLINRLVKSVIVETRKRGD